VTSMHHARTAYARPQTSLRSQRNLEYDLLARAAQRLQSGWENRKKDFVPLAAAVNENNILWSTLAADVADGGNGLPQALRARLFYLYQFSEAHGRKVLSGTASVDVLVDINMAVMRGLRGETGGRT